MATHNSNNERIKRRYLVYLREAKRQNESTLDAVASALNRFEENTKHRDFKAFHHEQAVAFKKRLAEQKNEQTGRKLSNATRHAILSHLKRFFQWLSGQPSYKSRFQYSDADYFNLSDKDARIATTSREQTGPTLEQVKHVISIMPNNNEIEQRNRALIAFTILTGARDSAIASMKLKHIDLTKNSIYQDAREVQTKYSKTFTTFFFPIGDNIREIVADWVTYLCTKKLWGNDDPLFPATSIGLNTDRQFDAIGLGRQHWHTTTPIRAIFKEAFRNAKLPYFNPHSFRNTLVRLGEAVCQTPEDFKAWSQNLGHEGVLTTFRSYGSVAERRQGELISKLGLPRNINPEVSDLARALLHEIHQFNQEEAAALTVKILT